MKYAKKIITLLLCVALVGACFSGCSSQSEEKYSDETLIIGYTDSVAPFIEVDDSGKATGFIPDLWSAIFDSVKGDLKGYVFEKVDEGYTLEEDGGFTDSNGKVYSAGLLMGAVSKNSGTVNEDYSFTQPIITNRVIAVVGKESQIKTYADFAGVKVAVVSEAAKTAFDANSAISSACKSVSDAKDIDEALALLDGGKVDAIITDEFSFMPSEKADSYTVLEHELDTIEYVIACAKYSGWKDSINEGIREYKSEKYNKNGDEFTPLVEKYFGYYASTFEYETEGDK